MDPNLSDSNNGESTDHSQSPDIQNDSEEVRRLRVELKNKDCQLEQMEKELKDNNELLERRGEELEKIKRLLNSISKRSKIFYNFSSLPIELRHLIYARFPLFDRVSAAKSSRDMEAYFMKYPMEIGSFSMYLKREDAKVYVKVVYDYERQIYVEMHLVPPTMMPLIQEEVDSFDGCKCEYCEDSPIRRPTHQIRYFSNDNLDTVFETMRICRAPHSVDIKSSPVGGLVDLIQPFGQLPKGRFSLEIDVTFHLSTGSIRNDPRLNLDNWRKWMNYWQFVTISFYDNLTEEVFVHRDLFDLPAIANVPRINVASNADINYRQLMGMKAHWILFESENVKLDWLTPMDMLHFYKAKIKEWLKDPSKRFYFVFQSAIPTENPPHLNYRRLLDEVEEDLKSEDFRAYLNAPHWAVPTGVVGVHNITILCVETNEILGVTADRMSMEETWDSEIEKNWPEHIHF